MITKFTNNLIKLIISLIFLILLSLFFSISKIYIPIIISVIFFFIRKELKKILLINLIIFISLIKVLSLSLNIDNTLSKIIYEKHFLYGVRNLDSSYAKETGDLSSFIDDKKIIKSEKIKIKTDQFGFRNDEYNDNFDYIFVGDSFLHQSRLNQYDLLNYNLKRNKINSYNAGLSVYDISHYFEVIKFFKKKKNFKNKFIMFIYPPNDFIAYGKPKTNYHTMLNNGLFFYFLEIRKFLNMHSIIKYLRLSFKSKSENLSTKVKSYSINNNQIFFYDDYMNSYKRNISFSKEFNVSYKRYLPDLVLIIPSKFDIYCNFIDEVKCNINNYKKKIISNKLFGEVQIIDITSFLIKKAAEELQKNNFIYDLDDTHLNSLGSAYLSEFLIERLK